MEYRGTKIIFLLLSFLFTEYPRSFNLLISSWSFSSSFFIFKEDNLIIKAMIVRQLKKPSDPNLKIPFLLLASRKTTRPASKPASIEIKANKTTPVVNGCWLINKGTNVLRGCLALIHKSWVNNLDG
ncbi:hypothetical protein KAT63_04275, partial [Candidatus Parcubacteria bacterium]|nr:hypothetical protein [Candidatus Parcubacteria bacterium]